MYVKLSAVNIILFWIVSLQLFSTMVKRAIIPRLEIKQVIIRPGINRTLDTNQMQVIIMDTTGLRNKS